MSERSLIDWLRGRIGQTDIVQVGPGDDAAVLAPAGDGRVVVTTDAFLEGTHFAPDDLPAGIGHKVIAASVSDIAAMGARKGDALLLADCVTSLGGVDLRIDEWNVDIAYSGTQKCLGVAPGLAPLTVSDRAIERILP